MSLVRLLQDEFASRRGQNPRYSMRAFATRLGVDQSLLSKFLRGERAVSQGTVVKILRGLQVEPRLARKYVRRTKPALSEGAVRYNKLSDKQFESISRWYAFALLELLQLPRRNWSAKSAAAALGMPVEEINEVLTALVAAGAIEKTAAGYRCRANYNSWTNTCSTSENRKRLQKDLLKKAVTAVDEVLFEKRCNLSVTFNMSSANLPKAQKLAEKFGKAMVDLAEKNMPHDEVYQMTVALFPLTQLGEEK